MSKNWKTTKNLIETTSEKLLARVYEKKPVWYDSIMKYPPLKHTVKNHTLNSKSTFTSFDATYGKKTISSYVDPSKEVNFDYLTTLKKKSLLDGSYIKKDIKNMKKLNVRKGLYSNNKADFDESFVGLQFLEDKIQDKFYYQHPWELAVPKLLIESQNKITNLDIDWSVINPRGVQVSGYSVAKRTMYLMKNEELSLLEAYNKALKEFYDIRINEKIEANIAMEENEMYGALYSNYKNGMIDQQFLTEQKHLTQYKDSLHLVLDSNSAN